jgi:putative tricarboxylic transport membrane protein
LWRYDKKFAALTVIALTALVLLWRSQAIAPPGHTGGIGPAFWPTLALIGVLLGVVVKCVEMMFQRRSTRGFSVHDDDDVLDVAQAFVVIVAIVATVALIESVGFVFANFLFLFAFLWITGLRGMVRRLLVAAVGTIGMAYVFVSLVYVPLPRGLGVFEDATIWLYRLLGIF